MSDLEHPAYLAHQGAIVLHVPTARASALTRPVRIVIDLDPPEGATALLVRRAARLVCERLGELGLASVPVATGSKLATTSSPPSSRASTARRSPTRNAQARDPPRRRPPGRADDGQFRVALRGKKVFVDWLRNNPGATVVSPYSLRARPRASVATPLRWEEIDGVDPDTFTIADVDRLLDRPDSLADLAVHAIPAGPFVAAVDAAFERSGLTLESFDRFRS